VSIGINAANLATEGLDLEIAGGTGEPIRVVLGPSGGLTGRYEQADGRIGLREIAAHQLSVQALSLPVAQGMLRVDAPSILSRFFVDAELGGGRPLAGRATVASAGVHVLFERGPLVVRAELSLAGVAYERSALAGQRAELESLEIHSLRVELQGKPVVHAEGLVLQGVRVTVEPGGDVSLRCNMARAESVFIEHGGRSIQLHQVESSKGFELQGDKLRWPELSVERLVANVPELPARRAESSAPPPPSAAQAPLDLPLLDHLSGLLALDLLLDIRIPILPDRRATHSIRLPIIAGAIDFKQLEGCLAGLENALLDFEVNEEGLILELDPIPGVSFDNVTLVTWPLSGHDHVVAKTQQKIRLRRLLDYRLSPKLASASERPASHPEGAPARPSALRRLHAGHIGTVLKLGGPIEHPLPGLGTLRLGAPGAPAVGELRLSGQVDHTPGQPPSATELRIDASDLLLGALIVDGSGRHAEVERLGIGRIDGARVGLLGLQPRSVSLDAKQVRIGGVDLRGWFGRAGAS
jgi:hypothetical protein